MNIRAVLFDLDGVLLKSMEQHLEAWRHAFRRYNTLVKKLDFYQLEGRGVNSVVEILTDKYGIDAKFRQQIVDEKMAYYKEKFHPVFYNGKSKRIEPAWNPNACSRRHRCFNELPLAG